jgi:2-keto-4-pentenoate hydratase
MIAASRAELLTERLFAARQTPGDPVDLAEPGLSRSDGLALQLRVADRYAASGDPVGGWKVAYTSGGQRDRMGPGYRAFGFIPASRVLPSGATVPRSAFRRPGVEIELCLRVDAHGAATGVAPAFELIDKRTGDAPDDGTVLADGCANWGIVVGEFRPLPATPLTGLTATLSRDGTVVCALRPGDTMDDPALSLTRLHERLAEHGRAVAAGQCVITGSITKAAVDAPGRWTGEVESLGSITVTFS